MTFIIEAMVELLRVQFRLSMGIAQSDHSHRTSRKNTSNYESFFDRHLKGPDLSV